MMSLARHRAAVRPSGQGLAEYTALAKRAVAPAPPADATVPHLVAEFIAQAKPVVVDEIVPILTRDTALQRNVGAAAGSALGEHLSGPVTIAAVAVTAAAGVVIWRMLAR